MKFSNFFSACILALPVGVSASDTVIVPMTAKITNSTCAAGNELVTLPDIYEQDFGGVAGKEVSSTTMAITVNCSTVLSNVSFRTGGTMDPDVGERTTFKNTYTGADAATGVGVNIYYGTYRLYTDKGLQVNGPRPGAREKSVSIPLTVKYVSTRNTITPGKVSTVMTFYWTYS